MDKSFKNVFNFLVREKKISGEELDLVKKVELFKHLDQTTFDKMSKDFELITFKKDKQIFRQGEEGDALYIIIKGSVRVYVHDSHGDKIALARLNEGDYFGEQAIIGAASKTRNANIESITDVILIKIPAVCLLQALKDNEQLRKKLKTVGTKQAINVVLSSLNFYDELKSIFASAGQTGHVVDFTDNKIIFNQGDKPDFAYLILSGEVELLIADKKTGKISGLVLHKGQLFGEMSILTGKTRHATAIAKKHLKVLAISSEFLKSHNSQNNRMRQLLSSLQRSYRLPLPYHGVVEQFIGTDPEAGLSLTNIFKMDDGRTIVSEMSLDNDSFAIAVNNKKSDKVYEFKEQNKVSRKILISTDYIVGAEAAGYWEDLPDICHLILENKKTEASWFREFSTQGNLITSLSAKSEQREIVCDCMQVSRKTLQECINSGVKDFAELSAKTGACTVCRCCKYRILEMLGENPWLSATVKHTTTHNEYIRSFEIKLSNTNFKNFLPGQHIVIQAKVNENWLERIYTISDTSSSDLRITVKKEPQGAFTKWLFETAPLEFNVFVTQPQGNFIIDKDESKSAVCFAGGIGITPFITYAKALAETNSKKIFHVVYCALKPGDFIFKDEFAVVTGKLPNVEIFYLDTETQGLINQEKIAKIIAAIKAADVYICGSQGFEQSIRNTLKSIQYDESRIHSEQFVHAGSAK